MKPKIRKAFLISLIILCLLLLWIYRPYPSYDPDKVAPELSSLQEPFQLVEGTYFLDGGSVGIRIIDLDGIERSFAIPHHTLASRKNPQELYVGALHSKNEGATKIAYTDDARTQFAEILRNAEGCEKYRDLATFHLSERWRDSITFLVRRFVSRDYEE